MATVKQLQYKVLEDPVARGRLPHADEASDSTPLLSDQRAALRADLDQVTRSRRTLGTAEELSARTQALVLREPRPSCARRTVAVVAGVGGLLAGPVSYELSHGFGEAAARAMHAPTDPFAIYFGTSGAAIAMIYVGWPSYLLCSGPSDSVPAELHDLLRSPAGSEKARKVLEPVVSGWLGLTAAATFTYISHTTTEPFLGTGGSSTVDAFLLPAVFTCYFWGLRSVSASIPWGLSHPHPERLAAAMQAVQRFEARVAAADRTQVHQLYRTVITRETPVTTANGFRELFAWDGALATAPTPSWAVMAGLAGAAASALAGVAYKSFAEDLASKALTAVGIHDEESHQAARGVVSWSAILGSSAVAVYGANGGYRKLALFARDLARTPREAAGKLLRWAPVPILAVSAGASRTYLALNAGLGDVMDSVVAASSFVMSATGGKFAYDIVQGWVSRDGERQALLQWSGRLKRDLHRLNPDALDAFVHATETSSA